MCVVVCKLQEQDLERVDELHQPCASPLEVSKTYLPPIVGFFFLEFWVVFVLKIECQPWHCL